MVHEPIFVWRVEEEDFGSYGEIHHGPMVEHSESILLEDRCKYCNERLRRQNETSTLENISERPDYEHMILTCELCGWSWWHEYYIDAAYDGKIDVVGEHILREFDIRSPELSLEELGSFLRHRYDKVHTISPRQLEQLVGDVFKNQGYKIQFTKTTHDGGYDILLLEAKNTPAIVEVKRYKNTIGVALVRQLRGVQIREGIPHAKLVTTSKFSYEARHEARAPIPKQLGFTMDLVDADELLQMLSVYRKPTFTIHEFEMLRHKIRFRQNSESNRIEQEQMA